MGSVNAPFGLRVTGQFARGSLETFRQYPILSGYNTNIAAGDVVLLTDNGTSTTITKQTGTGDTSTDLPQIGVFMGCSYTDPSTGQVTFNNMWPAGTVAADARAFVCDDPQALYVVQADGAISNTLDIYGKNIAYVQGAVSTVFRASRVAVGVATISNDNNLPARIVDYLGGPSGNEVGTAYPLLIVKLNYTQFTAAAGV
ncbi:MAG: hypothetical protein QM805_07635 [Pseudomonas sp.]